MLHAKWPMLISIAIVLPLMCSAGTSSQWQSGSAAGHSSQAEGNVYSLPAASKTANASDDLQEGTALTRQGRFSEAIPRLLAAQRQVTNDYALNFNLALCYVGISDYEKAIQLLDALRKSGHDDGAVENLLAQAYVASGQKDAALDALKRGAAISPHNEKLFTFVADACADSQDFEFGLKVVELGLHDLPQSARLHYERAVFLSQLDQFDRAKNDFEAASQLGQGSEIGYLSSAYKNLLEGNISDTVRIARQSINQGFQSPTMLTILGQALLRSGISPGQPEFTEAQNALEKSVTERPNDASSQIALGQIDLSAGRLDEAITHLEIARRMKPNQPAIYASLAKAYQRKGDAEGAHEALNTLQSLNVAQADRIRNASGERKASYGGRSSSPQ